MARRRGIEVQVLRQYLAFVRDHDGRAPSQHRKAERAVYEDCHRGGANSLAKRELLSAHAQKLRFQIALKARGVNVRKLSGKLGVCRVGARALRGSTQAWSPAAVSVRARELEVVDKDVAGTTLPTKRKRFGEGTPLSSCTTASDHGEVNPGHVHFVGELAMERSLRPEPR